MEIKTHDISDIEEMKRIEPFWNVFIAKYGKSPFLLSGFIYQLLKPTVGDFKPRILVFSIDTEIVGIVSAKIRNGLFRDCSFFQPSLPDFVFEPRYSLLLLRETVKILLRNWGCKLVNFYLPATSPYPPVLKEACKEFGSHLSSSPVMGSAILRVSSTWAQFEKARRNLRREVKRTGCRMKEIGQLNIKWFGNGDSETQVLERIIEVERASWKSTHEALTDFKVDPYFPFFINGCFKTSLIEPNFNWGVALLELNGKAIAYSMFTEYKGYAYISKTSFDGHYSKHSPGIYINHAVVRELINRTNVKVIDFITDLPFLHKWASEVVPANRFIISQKGIAPLRVGRAIIVKFPNAVKAIIRKRIKFEPT